MKATKYTVVITMEMLSLDCVPSLMQDAAMLLNSEANQAMLSHDDGDLVKIDITQMQVTI